MSDGMITGFDVGGEDYTVITAKWQRARGLDSAPAAFRGALVWVAGRPQRCDCGHPPEHLAYMSNLQLGGVLLWIGADYVELLSEFAESVEIERVEVGP